MKSITIEVPRAGKTFQLVLRAGASAGNAVIVVSEDVEIRPVETASGKTVLPKSPPTTNRTKASAPKLKPDDLDGILQRLRKLNPTKRAATVNSIKAMFQFDTPINDEKANGILDALCKRGEVIIEANDKIRFRHAT